MRSLRSSIVIAVVLVGVAACNPLVTDPASVGGEFDETAVVYSGPGGVWLQASVTGAPDAIVYGFALIFNADLHGPTVRSCGGDTVTQCDVTALDVRMPQQVVVAPYGAPPTRLMTVWPGETIQVALVCVDPDTQALGCPPSLRLVLHTFDEDGNRAGVLAPVTTPGP